MGLSLKTCSKCKTPKTRDNFRGKESWCIDCQRIRVRERARIHHWLRKTVTKEGYESLLKEQQGACAICKTKPDLGRILRIDHDHTTDKIRSLLCVKCNAGLGMFNDSLTLLLDAANYLLRHKE